MPDFVGIGAMRAGTSWYARNLRKHPDIYIGTKEIHFFDRRIHEWRLYIAGDFVNQLRYGNWFWRGKLSGRVTGEYTPAYGILEREKIALVKSWMPDVKLIFSMRDPAQRAWSQARKHFPQFHGKPVEQASRDELMRFFSSEGVVSRGDYASCLANWLSYFPIEQLHTSYLEDVERQPKDILKSAFTFLEVDAEAPIDWASVGIPVNSRAAAVIPPDIDTELQDLVFPQRERLRRILGRAPPW